MQKKYSIYYLQNPITKAVFYVGATSTSLNTRLIGHYAKLKEVTRGIRINTPTFEYLKNLLPIRANIVLIQETTIDEIDNLERYYINMYSQNNTLTNMMDGGKGGATFKVQSEQNKIEIGNKIRNKLKGIAKPEGFGANLSVKKAGYNSAKTSKYGWFVMFNPTTNEPLKLFKFAFEIEKYFNKPNGAITGNVIRICKAGRGIGNGFKWKFYNNCSKEIQDIVQSTYESL